MQNGVYRTFLVSSQISSNSYSEQSILLSQVSWLKRRENNMFIFILFTFIKNHIFDINQIKI